MNKLPMICLAACIAVTCGLQSTAEARDRAESIEFVQQRMVKIFGAGGLKRLYGYGTGFLVSSQGHIVTVWSTVLDGDSVTVVLDDGRRFDAKVLGAEPQLDLAVLKIELDDPDGLIELPHFTKDDFGTAGPGTRILGFSNMFKVATGDEPVSVLHGVVAAKTKLEARRGRFEIPYSGSVYIVDAITNNPGAGGGVIASTDGKLLGMIGKEVRNTKTNTWINYAVPIMELDKVIQSIIDGKYVSIDPQEKANQKPNYSPLDFGMVMVPDVLYRTPAYLDTVLKDSLAAGTELKRDDLVLFVNDELIQSVKTLKRELGVLEEGDDVRMIVRRGDKLIRIQMRAPKKSE